MLKGEQQVELAMLRLQLRAIDAEIVGIRAESRRYRQMRFALDIKEIQLTAQLDQRDACVLRIEELRRKLHLSEPRRHNLLAWLLVPVALWLHFQQFLASRFAEAEELEETVEVAERARSTPAFSRDRVAIGVGN